MKLAIIFWTIALTVNTYSQTSLNQVPLDSCTASDMLEEFIGQDICRYPEPMQEWGFWALPFVKKGMQRILSEEYQQFMDERLPACEGCEPSQVEAGVFYTSGAFPHFRVVGFDLMVEIKTQNVYIFWFDGDDYRLYGDRPIPQDVLEILNQKWIHELNFKVIDDSLVISPSKQ